MNINDLGELRLFDYAITAKTLRKDKELEQSVMNGEQAIAVTVKGTIRGYIATRKLLELWNVTPFVLPYGLLFLSHYGVLWDNIEDDGRIFAFGEQFPIAIAASLFRGEK